MPFNRYYTETILFYYSIYFKLINRENRETASK